MCLMLAAHTLVLIVEIITHDLKKLYPKLDLYVKRNMLGDLELVIQQWLIVVCFAMMRFDKQAK